MKRVLALVGWVVLSAVLCGCDEWHQNPGSGQRDTLPLDVVVFYYKGHEYLHAYKAGLLHSASCPCQTRDGRVEP